MLFYLFLLFTVVPIVELSLLIWLGRETAWWIPILVVIVNGAAGALLWRWQGIRTLVRIRSEMAAGQMPADALVDGLIIFFAGGLLITPGVITDAVGFALLIPPVRLAMKLYAKAWFVRHVEVRTAAFHPAGSASANSPLSGGDKIIDARVSETRVEDL
jgi:UPF0716 protein FxsA